MTKRQAEMWAEEITKILTGKPLITVSVTPIGLSIQQNRTFDHCYIVDFSEDNNAIGIVDSSGSVSGNEGWEIIPDQKMITLEKINGFGEPLIFAWCIIDNDDSNIWQEVREAQKRIWQG